MHLILRALAVGLMGLALSSCQRGLRIEVTGSTVAPDFRLHRSFLFDPPPGIDSLVLVEVVNGSSRTVWAIARDPSCAPMQEFRLGRVPDGWRELTAPLPLRAGVTYVLTASGCGFYGGKTFKVLRGRFVARDGNGEAPIRAIQAAA
jgi:hypothetical protein